MRDGVQVDLYWSFLALGVDLEDLILGLEGLEDGAFVVLSEDGEKRHERVVVNLVAGFDKVAVHFLEIWPDYYGFLVGLLFAPFSGLHLVNWKENAITGYSHTNSSLFMNILQHTRTLFFYTYLSPLSLSSLHLRNETPPIY